MSSNPYEFEFNCFRRFFVTCEFAKKQGVLPGIVIGRIQNDRKDYSFLAKYREKYVWQ